MIQVPDDASDEEIGGILSQGASPMRATPKQAAGTKPVDPRFFAPMPSGYSGTRSPANTVDPRFLTTTDTSAAGGATDSGSVGQNSSASTLGMSLFYAAQQDPGQYARLLHLQDLTGIPPIVSAGHETEIQQWVDANRIDPHYFTAIAPNTAVWACDLDNAAVSGVDEILRLGRIEQNAAAMRAQPPVAPSWWDKLKSKTSNGINNAENWVVDKVYDTFHPSAPVTPKHDDFSDEAAAATRERFNADNPTNSLTSLRYRPPAKPGAPQGPTPGPSLEDIANAELVREGHDPTIGDISDRDHLNPLEQQMYADQLRKIYAQVTLDVERGMHGDGWTPQEAFDTLPQGRSATTKDPLVYESQLARLVAEAHPDFARWIGLPSLAEYRTLDVVNPDAAQHAEEILPLGAIFEHDKSKAGRFAQGVAEGLGSLTTPANVALMVGTMGLGTTAKVGAAALDSPMLANFLENAGPRWVSGLFAAGMLPGDVEQGSVLYNQIKNGQYDEALRTLGQLAVTGTMTLLAGAHALRGKPPVGEGPEESDNDGDGGGPGPRSGNDLPFWDNLSEAMAEAADSKLRGRSPKRFYQALQAIFQGHDSLQIPVEQFNDYFTGKSMDPAAVAREIGAENYADATSTPGAGVEVPTENFLGKLDPEDQQGLLPDVVDPASGMTLREHQGLQRWLDERGLAKSQAELAQSDPEVTDTPEWHTATEVISSLDEEASVPSDSIEAAGNPGYADQGVQGYKKDQTAALYRAQLEGVKEYQGTEEQTSSDPIARAGRQGYADEFDTREPGLNPNATSLSPDQVNATGVEGGQELKNLLDRSGDTPDRQSAADANKGAEKRRGGGENAYTKLGRQKHQEFTIRAKARGWLTGKRYVDPKTGKIVIPDAVTKTGHPIELKPDTPRGRARGRSQLKAQERATGKKGRVIYYKVE